MTDDFETRKGLWEHKMRKILTEKQQKSAEIFLKNCNKLASIQITQRKVAKAAGVSIQTVSTSVHVLEEKKLLRRWRNGKYDLILPEVPDMAIIPYHALRPSAWMSRLSAWAEKISHYLHKRGL